MVHVNIDKTEAKIKSKMQEQRNIGFANGGILGTLFGLTAAIGINIFSSSGEPDYEEIHATGYEQGQEIGYEEGQKSGYEQGINDTLACFEDYMHFANITSAMRSDDLSELDQTRLREIWDEQNHRTSHDICSDVGHPFDLDYSSSPHISVQLDALD